MTHVERIENDISKIGKGRFTKMKYKGEIKGAENLLKITDIVIRIGIEYEKQASVKLERANGKEKTTRTYNDKIIVPNTIFESKDGRKKLRVYVSNNIHHRAKSKFYDNGIEVSKQELLDKGIIKPSKARDVKCFEIFLDNIISIG
jgi:hypothetical protein